MANPGAEAYVYEPGEIQPESLSDHFDSALEGVGMLAGGVGAFAADAVREGVKITRDVVNGATNVIIGPAIAEFTMAAGLADEILHQKYDRVAGRVEQGVDDVKRRVEGIVVEQALKALSAIGPMALEFGLIRELFGAHGNHPPRQYEEE